MKRAECTSVLQRYWDQVRVRDSLLQIANLYPNFSLFEHIPDQRGANYICKRSSPLMIQLLSSCFVNTKSTRKITTLDWPTRWEKKFFTFCHDNCIIDQETCWKKIYEKQSHLSFLYSKETVVSSVSVRKFNLSWLFKDNRNFLGLV